MKHKLLTLTAIPTLALVLFIRFAGATTAMPEYASQVGEPCASCHVSAAGGGLRNVRGQAWVLTNRPAKVPEMNAALEALGIRMPADMRAYTDAPVTVPPAAPLQLQPADLAPLLHRLLEYEGN